jgi:hypothetical protein
MLSDFLGRVPARFWVLLVLVVWGGFSLLLVRYDSYGLDEGAAHALLLNWTIVDNVANPVGLLGVPDFRALLFIPLGIYWSGSLTAAKVFTLLITFAAAVLLYQWSARKSGKEAALIATGLLLISPVALMQSDSLGAGAYLLVLFACGAWLEQSYRTLGPPLGGKYFTQMLLVIVLVSLHPAGLAYPLALAWHGYKQPLNPQSQRYVFIGIAVAVAFVGLLRAGWHGVEFWVNPLIALQSALLGPVVEKTGTPIVGLMLALALLAVLIVSGRKLLDDFMGTVLGLALLLGAMAADLNWAMLVVVMVLYYGAPWMIRLNETLGGTGLIGQRGGVLLVILVLATLFMSVDKAYYSYSRNGLLSAQDELIRTLALEAGDTSKPFRAASQWPARTMIAVRRDVLPLPPPARDPQQLLKMISGITHIMFDPYVASNLDLARNIAQLSGVMETFAPQPGGVIVKRRDKNAGDVRQNTVIHD